MEQNNQFPLYPPVPPPLPQNNNDKTGFLISFLKNHKILGLLSILILIFILPILIYAVAIPNFTISKITGDKYEKYDISLKNNIHQVVISDPQYVYPYYSKIENEFGNKIILIRNDVPKSMQDFLAVRSAYFYYFGSINSILIREIMSDIPGFLHYPTGFIRLIASKISSNQYGYTQGKKDKAQQNALAENQKEVSLYGQLVEYIKTPPTFRTVVRDEKTLKNVVENDFPKQFYLLAKDDTKYVSMCGIETSSEYFKNKADNASVFVYAEGISAGSGSMYLKKLQRIPGEQKYVNKEIGISFNYPGYWQPPSTNRLVNDINGMPLIFKANLEILERYDYETPEDKCVESGYFDVSVLTDRYESAKKYLEENYKNNTISQILLSNDQFAFIAFPSSSDSEQIAVIVAKYPTPIEIRYDCSYDKWSCAEGKNYYSEFFSYVVVKTTPPFAENTAKSLEFISQESKL